MPEEWRGQPVYRSIQKLCRRNFFEPRSTATASSRSDPIPRLCDESSAFFFLSPPPPLAVLVSLSGAMIFVEGNCGLGVELKWGNEGQAWG